MSFSSVLIANRGEIARRVIRACSERGLRSIAVYSEADADAAFVREADHAVLIGPASPLHSYLDVERILAAAKESGAEAVHPGYGFLSERADFARAVADAGLVWIGPSADVIEVMGRKDRARELAERAGVPVTARFDEGDVPADAYPVLVKAAAGGGGKGMHVVRDPADLEAAIATARREASSAFGDDTLLIETYVERGKHVEVQVLADAAGNVVALADRDCSAQRRHQKIVEEAPAPFLDASVHAKLRDASIALCKEVGYTNAGTVEYLVTPDGNAYFLEMNTRLQVEHPVTEEVTGIDLVQAQLDVAAGRSLQVTQDEVEVRGHAIEVRVYAEDPYAGFLPQSGTIDGLVWPDDARIEAAFDGPGVVTTSYDPMVAKIIVHGADREAARLRLIDALDEAAVFGLVTNLGFARRLVASPEFAAGEVHTSWLDGDEAAALLEPPPLPVEAMRVAADVLAAGPADPSPFALADGWRSAGPSAARRVALMDLDGVSHWVDAVVETPHALWHKHASGAVTVVWQGQPWVLTPPDPMRQGRDHSLAGDAEVTAPMPGTVLSIDVVQGDTVTAGQRLGTVEAMKMELALTAPHDGVVTEVEAKTGDQVKLGQHLLTVEASES
ncbi:acetyl/propionyl/methylcrotonyl-CoA carboxylase subunit alpha [Aeromicrobium terrae]|uniref:ATP-grasp domain-containing protein n=1 Tax=Aeromicrobium terrae TaxID=2498846 RepID=A0A5C8NFY2_9ACTN|nr:biotin carboxylase N-terminal domain-containing protein [Aeromicrobium terrae]TXL57458.1 ATP-grasp domain-containing protein [Aeromicrobium terrae]